MHIVRTHPSCYESVLGEEFRAFLAVPGWRWRTLFGLSTLVAFLSDGELHVSWWATRC